MIQCEIILVDDGVTELPVAAVFESLVLMRESLKTGVVTAVIRGRQRDVIALNVRLRTELDIDTCVIHSEQIGDMFNDGSTNQNSFRTISSGELVDIAANPF
jgi:hypothetical protein